jgi:hypothetical protein
LKYQLETAGSAAVLAARISDGYIEITWSASRTDQGSSCFGSGIRSNYLLFTGGVRWLKPSHFYQARTVLPSICLNAWGLIHLRPEFRSGKASII